MPENQCKSCTNSCGIIIHSTYLRDFTFAWTFDEPLPICIFYKESSFHGLEGVRA